MSAVRVRSAAPAVVPAIAAASAAMRMQFGPGLSIALIAALVLVPVWWGALRRYAFARTLLGLGLGAVAWGAVTTLLDSQRPWSTTLLMAQTFALLSMLGGIGLLLWARTHIGTAWTTAFFGVGALLNVVLTGGNTANLWKYSLALPVALIALGLASRTGSRGVEAVVLIALAGISAVSDSRSMTAFLLLAAALVIWQVRAGGDGSRPRPWQTLVGIAVLALAVFALFQALLLDGVLGDAAQQRTQAQLDASGSLITGGRPELGAALALIGQQPWGYGSGTIPTSADVWLAKSGMSELNYDPNNGYVEVFMFGGHYEVHSVLGDLWIRFGPLGALLALAVVGYAVYATARAVSLRAASGALVLLTLLGVWDTFFSPFLTSYRTLALLVALAAIPIADAGRKVTAGRSRVVDQEP